MSESGLPSGTGGVSGVIDGGYVTNNFSGVLESSPDYTTHGRLGSFDLECTSAYNCPGARPSFLSYFSSATGWNLADWGWTYHTARNGDWVNSSAGNTGDITSGHEWGGLARKGQKGG